MKKTMAMTALLMVLVRLSIVVLNFSRLVSSFTMTSDRYSLTPWTRRPAALSKLLTRFSAEVDPDEKDSKRPEPAL
ncbi:MAG: hypothetical protein ACD_47C00006G0003 [uncultured bacterium]|nr:MAG: hypothetical protein ACD_47C00006G0003 [uncultured bacterium]